MDSKQQEQLEQEVTFANSLRQVVDNEAYKIAMTTRKAQCFEVFCKTSKDQSDVREEAWRTMINLTALEEYFETAATTGKMAEQTLDIDKKNN